MKMYIKAVLTALLIAIIILSLSACGSEKTNSPKMNIDYGKRADGSSYTIYNGDAQEFFGVAEGEENVIDVSVQKESGLLRILIHAENDPDTVIYDGHDFPMDHFTVTVKETGRYRMSSTAILDAANAIPLKKPATPIPSGTHIFSNRNDMKTIKDKTGIAVSKE